MKCVIVDVLDKTHVLIDGETIVAMYAPGQVQAQGITAETVIDATGKYTYMIDKDVNFIREAYPAPTTTGRPKYYGMFDGDKTASDGNFLIGPSPDVQYQVELHYYYDPVSIVTESTTWLGDNAPTTLLYGTLIEAYTYLKGDDDMMKTYMERYKTAMGQLMGIDARNKRDDYRDGRA